MWVITCVVYFNVIEKYFQFFKIGRQPANPKGQTVSLHSSGCLYTGTIMHEFIHALGNNTDILYL